MGGNYFDHIAREILQQQQLMNALQEENRELRRQLADLSTGRGIFIEIYGQRIALLDNTVDTPSSYNLVQSSSEDIWVEDIPIEASEHIESLSEEGMTEKALIPGREESKPVSVAAPEHTQTFLEEVMIDEFSAALTGPVPASTKQADEQENINEEQKALLRQELLGSYLLE